MIDIDENTSKRITSLRFLLMLFVMIKHNAIVKDLFMHEMPFSEPTAVTFIKEFFANGLGEIAGPVFFFFSGFLLASSDDSYFATLKKRFRSIFVPYTIWTVLYFIGWLVLKHFHFMYGNPLADWREWGAYEYLVRFAGYYHGYIFTFVGSFWFLRDLFIMVLLSPIIYFFVKKIPLITLVLSGCAYFMLPSLIIILPISLFFFELGITCSVYKMDFFLLADKFRCFELLLVSVTSFLFFFKNLGYNQNGGIHHSIFFFLFIFSGILGLLKFSNIIINNECAFSLAKKLAPYTFFTYAIHSPILIEIIKKLTYRITSVQTYEGAFRSLAQFVLACILDIGISLGTGILLSKICPPIFVVLSGGRRKQ